MTVQWQESWSLCEDLERGSLFFIPQHMSVWEGGHWSTNSLLAVLSAPGCAEDFWPKLCLLAGWRGCCGRLCHCFIHSACRRVASSPSGPAQDLQPSPNAQTSRLPKFSIPSPAQHPKTSAFGRSGLEPLSSQRSTTGCRKWGPFPTGVRMSVLTRET